MKNRKNVGIALTFVTGLLSHGNAQALLIDSFDLDQFVTVLPGASESNQAGPAGTMLGDFRDIIGNATSGLPFLDLIVVAGSRA